MRSYITYPSCCPWGWALPLEVGALLSRYHKVGNDGSEAAWSTAVLAYDTRIDWRRIVRRCVVHTVHTECGSVDLSHPMQVYRTKLIISHVRMIWLLVLFSEQVRNTSLVNTSKSLTLSQWCHQVIHSSKTRLGKHNSFLIHALNSFSYGYGLEVGLQDQDLHGYGSSGILSKSLCRSSPCLPT